MSERSGQSASPSASGTSIVRVAIVIAALVAAGALAAFVFLRSDAQVWSHRASNHDMAGEVELRIHRTRRGAIATWYEHAAVDLYIIEAGEPSQAARQRLRITHIASPYLVVVEDSQTLERKTTTTDNWIFTAAGLVWNDQGTAFVAAGSDLGEFRPGRSIHEGALIITVGAALAAAAIIAAAAVVVLRRL